MGFCFVNPGGSTQRCHVALARQVEVRARTRSPKAASLLLLARVSALASSSRAHAGPRASSPPPATTAATATVVETSNRRHAEARHAAALPAAGRNAHAVRMHMHWRKSWGHLLDECTYHVVVGGGENHPHVVPTHQLERHRLNLRVVLANLLSRLQRHVDCVNAVVDVVVSVVSVAIVRRRCCRRRRAVDVPEVRL